MSLGRLRRNLEFFFNGQVNPKKNNPNYPAKNHWNSIRVFTDLSFGIEGSTITIVA